MNRKKVSKENGRIALARKKLEEIEAAEKKLEGMYGEVRRLQGETEKAEQKLETLRAGLMRIVQFSGGSLELPELSRPLHVKTCSTLQYNTRSLLPWLKKNAPHLVRAVEEWRVDRRGLRRELHVRGSRAYLPGAEPPVRGIKVVETRHLVIPGREAEPPAAAANDNEAAAAH